MSTVTRSALFWFITFRRSRTWLPYLLVLVMTSLAAQETLVIRHIQGQSASDTRNEYPLKVLTLILGKAGVDYRLEPSTLVMPQSRALTLMESGQDIDIVWTMTSQERETHLLPIRIPIDKGLIGMRLLLIRSSDEAKFHSVSRLEHLQKFSAGQGHDWPDVAILESNGLKVEKCANYEGLFQMLINHHIDYFPRSAEEIWAEAEIYQDSGLIVEPTLTLHYPTARYFFVNKNNSKLASILRRGFAKAIKDGSFNKVFQEYNQNVLEALRGRRLFELKNPSLPPLTPIHKKELWFTP